MTKTVLVLGAQGVLGKFTARALRAAGFSVLRGGRRAEEAPDFRLVDLDRPGTLDAALEGVDLVVTSIPDPDGRAESRVIRHGGLLLSEASLPAPAQRRLDAEAKSSAVGTAVLNSGLTGVCALVAKELLTQQPKADTIEIGFIASVSGSAGLAGCRTAHGWLTAIPRLPTVRREFTPPHGVRPCFDLSQNDILWLSPELTSERRVLSYVGFAEKGLATFLGLLNRVGLLRLLPEIVLTAGVRLRPAPAELTREPIRMRVAVHAGSQLLATRGVDAEGDYNSTTLSTALFARLLLELADKQGVRPGLCCVEDLFELDDLRAELDQNRNFIRPLAT